MRIFLIGFMGSGKTKRGKEIAQKLGYNFFDLDELIQKKNNKTISEIFEKEGEGKFREYEHDSLKEIIKSDDYVLSTGGGTPCFNNNIDLMNQNGITVYLKAESSFLLSRLTNTNNDGRPLIAGKSNEELHDYIKESLNQREQYYIKAKYTFDALNVKNNDIVKVITDLSN